MNHLVGGRGLLQKEKHRCKKGDKEDWCLSSEHTCENMPMTPSPLRSFLVLTLHFLLSTSRSQPTILCTSPRFTRGIYFNNSHLRSHCNPSIIARDQLKITPWEAREWGWVCRSPHAGVINCFRDEYPITVRLRNGDGAGGVIAWLIRSSCNAWLILKCEWVFNQGHVWYDQW